MSSTNKPGSYGWQWGGAAVDRSVGLCESFHGVADDPDLLAYLADRYVYNRVDLQSQIGLFIDHRLIPRYATNLLVPILFPGVFLFRLCHGIIGASQLDLASMTMHACMQGAVSEEPRDADLVPAGGVLG
jgi:hypothetical protein